MMTLSTSPSNYPDVSLERNKALVSFHQEEVELSREVETMHQLCAKIMGQEKPDPTLFPQVETALITFGISAEEALADPELLQMLRSNIHASIEELKDENEMEISKQISIRILELKGTVDLQSAFQTLRLEFGDQIDEGTNAVFEKYEALFDPQFIEDEGERKVVESLFWKQNQTFTEESFYSFIDTIEEQPNEVISEESKQKIRERFPRKTASPKTGAELIKVIQKTGKDGSFLHHSPDTAVMLDSGVSAYTREDGKFVLRYSYHRSGRETTYTEINSFNRTPQEYTQEINTNTVRDLIAHEFNNLQGLFGGGVSDNAYQSHFDQQTTRNANRFLSCILGKRPKENLLTHNEIQTLKDNLKAFANPLNSHKTEDLHDMTELGIFREGEINWRAMEQAGQILRKNKGFKAQAMQDPSAPYQLLKQQLQSPKEVAA